MHIKISDCSVFAETLRLIYFFGTVKNRYIGNANRVKFLIKSDERNFAKVFVQPKC